VGAYKRWTERTGILIPFPPQLYAPLPTILKRTLFLEFPVNVFDPVKHADPKKVQDRQAEEGRSNNEQSSSESGEGLVKAVHV
jgi:hypothetical protein